MLESIRSLLARLAGLLYVKNPLLYFAALTGLICLELHIAMEDLERTQVYGLISIAVLAGLLCLIIVTFGRLTEKSPAHLYDDIELLKRTLSSKVTIQDVLGKLVSEQIRELQKEQIRSNDDVKDRETHLTARRRNLYKYLTGLK